MKNNIQVIQRAYNQLCYILNRKQKRTAIVVVILLVISSFFETLGVSAILPFIETLLTPEQVMEKWYAVALHNLFGIESIESLIIAIGLCVILVYVVKNCFLYLVTMIHSMYRSRIQKELSTKMLQSYMAADYEFFTQINTAEIQRGIGTDVDGVYHFMDDLFRFLGEGFTTVLIALFLVKTDAMMAIGVVLIAGLCFGFITFGLKKKTSFYGEQKRESEKERLDSCLQATGGFKEIKITQTTEYFVDAYKRAYEKQRLSTIKNESILNLPERMIETVCVGALLGIVCVKVMIGTDISAFAPKLSVFAVAAFRLLPAVSRMSRYMNGMIFTHTFMQGVYEHLIHINQYEVEGNSLSRHLEEKKSFEELLEVKHVGWQYRMAETPVLLDISLDIRKGEAVGLVGASGAGKSTLADIILGLLRPQKGQVLVDSISIYDCPKDWSKLVGYVPQNIFLLDDTIRANVGFGCKPEEIDDTRVWNALKEAQLDDFVRSKPEQLETRVGERGIQFSGGQCQRIAIARALYNNPDILVLDEATSALDHETEEAVMSAIDALHGQKTMIIVAHRLTTLRKCDRIYEIADGVAKERDYHDLIADK